MNMMGIIFSNIYDSAMGELTKHRTLASLPFGGRYRMVDFVLSNMSNSGLETIGVITKYNYQSLMDHLGSCDEWDLNRKNGRVFILPPFGTGQTTVYQGKLEALQGAMMYLSRGKGDYVLLSDSNIICNIDYDHILDAHIKSGKMVTMVGHRTAPTSPDETMNLVIVEENDEIKDIVTNHTYTKDDFLGMGMYVMEKELLKTLVREAASHGFYDFERDFIQRGYQENLVSINLYEFKGTVLRNTSTRSYFENHMALLDETVRQDIFNSGRPIYTKVRDEVPTFYHESSVVNNALVADGCRIYGTVENSVISRDVLIEKGAVVRNSIVMQGTVVRKGSELEYAIIDKDVNITENRTLIGAPTAPIIIQKGQKI